MKNIICFLLFALFTVISYSQEKKTDNDRENYFNITDEHAQFKNNICEESLSICFMKELRRYVSRNLEGFSNNLYKFGITAGKKRALISFLIDKKGYIRILKIKSTDPKINIHLKNALNALPQVIPSRRIISRGYPVKKTITPLEQRFNLPITFIVE
jgi:hypothetical protein